MITELTFGAAHNYMKVRIMEDKSIWASGIRTGLGNFYPRLIIDSQIKKAKKIQSTDKKKLKQFEEDIKVDEQFLKDNSIETIKEEIIKEQGLRGFKLIKEETK